MEFIIIGWRKKEMKVISFSHNNKPRVCKTLSEFLIQF